MAYPVNIRNIDEQMTYADNLFSQKHYRDAIDLLIPLEESVKKSTDPTLKFKFYSLLSVSLMHDNNFTKSIEFLEKSSMFNHLDLEDLICAANISAQELKDFNNTKKYARKALIKYHGNPNYENNVSLNKIGRLLYLLGTSYSISNDPFMATECLKTHSALNIREQTEINHDLTQRIESLNNINSTNSDSKTSELITINVVSDTVQRQTLNQLDEHAQIRAIESYGQITLDNLEGYLNNVLTLDSIYELNQDIYSSKRLLDKTIQNIIAANIVLTSHRGINLMVRLGRIYLSFKNNDEALEWLFMAKNRYFFIDGYDNTYLTLLNLIAKAYIDKDIFLSRLFIEEAIELFERRFGDIYENNSSEAHTLLNNYAYILQECNDLNNAENIYRHLLKECDKPNELKYILNNYGVLLSSEGRNAEAVYYYEQLDNVFPDISGLTNLIIAYIDNGELQKAELAFKQYIASSIVASINTWTKFTNYEIENLWNQYSFELYLSCNYFANRINSTHSLNYGFDATLFCKTLPFLYKSVMNSYANTCKRTNHQQLLNIMQHCKEDLIKINNPDTDNAYASHLKIEQLDDTIKRNLPSLFEKIMDAGITSKNISASLEEDEVAIEFFEFMDLSSDSIKLDYAAYIISHNNDAPVFVKIAPFQSLTSQITDIISDETELNRIYTDSNHTMYDTIWGKLIPFISNKKTIYYSTSGALSFINHNIIHDDRGIMLLNRFNLHRVSSTSQISKIKTTLTRDYTTSALFGNIDFEAHTPSMTLDGEKGSATFYSLNSMIDESELTRSGWIQLPNSNYEIKKINEIMNSVGLSTQLFEKKQANEKSFKKINGKSPDILHIATHGFTASKHQILENKHVSYTDHDRVLSFEGLLFSGANDVCQGLNLSENGNDGILTAEEISNMDLSGTKLVVLSACDTGKGFINLLGNVIGLQEAFKMAGVESILMSLWKVPDESTALLMTKFYEALLSGHNRHEALKIAMKKTKEMFPDPYYWGAFVILD